MGTISQQPNRHHIEVLYTGDMLNSMPMDELRALHSKLFENVFPDEETSVPVKVYGCLIEEPMRPDPVTLENMHQIVEIHDDMRLVQLHFLPFSSSEYRRDRVAPTLILLYADLLSYIQALSRCANLPDLIVAKPDNARMGTTLKELVGPEYTFSVDATIPLFVFPPTLLFTKSKLVEERLRDIEDRARKDHGIDEKSARILSIMHRQSVRSEGGVTIPVFL